MREFNYVRNGKKLVSVNAYVAKRRADGAKHPVIGKIANGKLIMY
jgi:hypothetical protein